MRSLALVLVVVVGGAGCKSSGSSSGAAVVGALLDVAAATAAERRAARRRARRHDDTAPLPPGDERSEDDAPVEDVERAGDVAQGRSPLPLYPEGLAVPVGPEDVTCDVDDDCVVLHGASCCDCAHGGVVVAVRADRAEALRALRDCEGASCTPAAPTPSCEAAPRCLHGLCRLLPPEPVPPPPTSPVGPAPVEIPEGYGPAAPGSVDDPNGSGT